ncbi:SDR family oxidoreductase [Amnibacterium sp.]|uniref:SDR family oxidoreductase n=1 Tax=Amnibacterium sp. TaxID=1872496 RepID=UPI003F7B54AF
MPTTDPLTGTTALVTGGSRGIGREIALRLAAAGHHVVLTYRRDAEAAAAVVARIVADGGSARAAHLELEDADGIDGLFAGLADGPPLAVLVANAAASAFKPLESLSAANLERSWATNTRSFVLLAQRAAPAMRRLGTGRIVAVTSYGSHRVLPRYGAIGADKAAIESWVRHMAAELGPDGITVNAVNGGVFDTDSSRTYYSSPGVAGADAVVRRVPLRRLGEPGEAAAAVAFLCSADAAYITGHVLVVDGGLTVVAPPFPSDLEEEGADA